MEKRNNFARLLSLTLCLIMLIGIMPVNAFAAKAKFKVISSVGITGIEEPVYGELPDTTGKVANSGVYEIESVRWKAQHNDKYLSGNSSFSAGTVYEVHITLKATGSNSFARLQNGMNNVEATINGEDANVTRAADAEDNSKYIDVVMSFPATEKIVYLEEVEVENLDEPEAGSKPDFDANTPNGGAKYIVTDIRWVKAGTNKELSNTDRFEYNENLYFGITKIKIKKQRSFVVALPQKTISQTTTKKCQNCNNDLPVGHTFCTNCGARADNKETSFCPYCRQKIGERAAFCSSCGKKLII